MSSIMDMISAKNNENMAEKVTGKREEQQVKAARPIRPSVNPIVVPKKKNKDDVIYRSSRLALAFIYATGQRAQFQHGFLVTNDSLIIKYIKDNFLASGMVTIFEESFAKETKQPEDKQETSKE